MSGFGGFDPTGPPGNIFGSSTPNPSGGFGSTPLAPNAFGSVAPFGSNLASSTSSTPTMFGGGNNNQFFGSTTTSATSFQSSGVPSTPFGTTSTTTTASGFGSPFGTAPVMPSSGFGTSQQTQQPSFGSTGFGSSFGASNTNAPAFGTSNTVGFGSANAGGFAGFGSNAPTAPSFGSATMSPNNEFGSSTPASNFSGFGSSTTLSGFGASSGPSGFGSSGVGGFGTINTGTVPFGTSAPQQQQQPGSHFGTSSMSQQPPPPSMFGSTPSSSATLAPPSFGGTQFGSPSPAAFGTSFSNTTNPFGSSGGFGNTTAPSSSTALSFGSSANVVPRANQGSSFASNTPFPSHSTTSALPPFPYGSSSFPNSISGTNSFIPSDSDDMDGDAGMSAESLSPFASPLHPTSSMSYAPPSALSPIQETMRDAEEEANMSPVPNESKAPTDEDARLSMLKAKMQAKKKKLEELRRRKEAHNNEAAETAAVAALALPIDQSLAERNAVRFAKTPTDSAAAGGGSSAPPSAYVDFSDPSRDDREDLENAVSLVGTCQEMCPEDELLRRQREGDIQLLELPQPGTIHPADWTIRDTAVKRFRRSAADYKLDVPEWVRPPDVLERVCGYLEEWVMERDRQGADPRFPQAGSPPPLDVYQFVWDRTRMIRKDFILQNYVGTGGNCDARAVRCHERIARWHAMCEHQLSHIPEFVTNQSQQNIQELGQTMKTLNQFYDDSLGRAIMEAPDDQGIETRTNLAGFSHGCLSDIVMGEAPTDFDGTKLNNTSNETTLSQRLLGKHAVNGTTHGTAEPEMRGLYILLTINNEGGMEVLKYAARLFRERPEIYHSEPVQLALNIYKAKKEYNYARFFSILKAPTTPYLFACIMFKHVELMRKIAFRIMSKTFGARRKDNGEAMYDEYPLKSLQRLLCFEDLEEARQACQHYNITVKQMKVKSPKSPGGHVVVDFIFWRISEFREPTDPEKGSIVILRPRKMIHSIENKLRGMTRLAVCRGEASGDQVTLSPLVAQVQAHEEEDPAQLEAIKAEEARLAAIMLKEEQKRRETEARRQEEERRRKEEQERLERQRQEQLLAMERKEEERKQKLIMQKQREEEYAKELAEEEERRRQEAEANAAREARLRQEAEEKRVAAEQEAARRRAEEEEKERLRLEEIRREQERLERERIKREQDQQLEEKRKRREVEMKRLALERMQEEEKERKREEARRAAEAWEREVMQQVKEFSIWLRWRPRMRRHYARTVLSRRSLRAAGNTFRSSEFGEAIFHAISEKQVLSEVETNTGWHRAPDARSVIEHVLIDTPESINVASLLRHVIQPGTALYNDVAPAISKLQVGRKVTLLLKIVVVLPVTKNMNNERMCSLVKSWLDARIALRKIWVDKSSEAGVQQLEIRAIAVNGSSSEAFDGCDVALFVIPPPWSTCDLPDDIEEMSKRVNSAVRRAVLVIPEQEYVNDHNLSERVDDFFSQTFADSEGKLARVFSPSKFTGIEFDSILINSIGTLLETYASDEQHVNPRIVDAYPLSKVCLSCINESLWSDQLFDARFEGFQVLARARASLKELVEALKDLEKDHAVAPWSQWPAPEFVEGNSYVPNYFGADQHLPICWNQLLQRNAVEPGIVGIFNNLKGQFPTAINNLTAKAPFELRHELDRMLEKRQLRRAFQRALFWWGESQPENERCIYLPSGILEIVVDSVLKSLHQEDVEQGRVKTSDRVVEPEVMDIDTMYEGTIPRSLREVERKAIQEEARHFTPLPLAELPNAPNTSDRSDAGKRPYSDPHREPKSERQSEMKRPRTESSKLPLSVSDEVKKSRAFTKKLESYCKGETFDMAIGDITLAEILRDAPSIDELLIRRKT